MKKNKIKDLSGTQIFTLEKEENHESLTKKFHFSQLFTDYKGFGRWCLKY